MLSQLRFAERMLVKTPSSRGTAEASPIMPGYLKTCRISLLRGRDFTDTDNKDSQRVAIIDEEAGLFACYLPARSAMQLDPVEALRYE